MKNSFNSKSKEEYHLKKVEFKGKIGLMDQYNLWHVAPMFDDLGCDGAFFDQKNYCRAQLRGKYGFINEYGSWHFKPTFDFLFKFDNHDYCLAVLNRKVGFINRTGEFVIQPMFEVDNLLDAKVLGDNIPEFNSEGLCTLKLNGDTVVINRAGVAQ